VVGIVGNPIRSEREDHVGPLLSQHARDLCLEQARRKVCQPAGGEPEPFVAIGGPPDDPPSRLIFSAPHPSELLTSEARIRRDLTGFTAGGMQQYEPQVAILPMQGNPSRSALHVVFVGPGLNRM
jgi:hypothetical protein